ncbi:tRNA (guanosine(46)-N7)-methyltransferase TrmB [Mycoplasmoides pirum]|uniref:tRNA (guanosine(46)-N7)-methyltransferase TrmB n=1 Tax=Mycoplasmoides pirum TaxID=2122 RepID=UPI0004867E47|nr:tRNA (guanosine(46)-N7)-methyltransferase TrmB [Mycoplasmoides pirum]
MRLRNNPNALNICENSSYFLKVNNLVNKKISDLYKNNNKKNYIEIGSGKGGFLWENAYKNSNINYLGIEKFLTVIAKSIKKYETNEKKLNNILLTCLDANEITSFISEKSVDKIFLNFSDPWPKKRHCKRRLIDINFLNKYEIILKKDGLIEFKTDNDNLFEYCLEQIELKHNIEIIAKTIDLHNLPNDDYLKINNIETEYEKKFVANNIKIKKIIFCFK